MEAQVSGTDASLEATTPHVAREDVPPAGAATSPGAWWAPWLVAPAALLLYLLGSAIGSVLALVLLATVLRRLIPGYYDMGLNLYTLRFALGIPAVLTLFIALSTACTIGVVLLAARASGRPWRERLGLMPGRIPASEVPLLVLASLGTLCIGWLLAMALQHAGLLPPIGRSRQQFGEALLMASPATKVAFVLSAGLLAGLSEELLCRGWMQRALMARWRPAASISVASVTFALLHGDLAYDVLVLPSAFFLGYLAWRADSIRPTIACHAVVNALVLTSLAVFGLRHVVFMQRVFEPGTGGQAPPARVALALAVPLIVSVALVWTASRRVERHARAVGA